MSAELDAELGAVKADVERAVRACFPERADRILAYVIISAAPVPADKDTRGRSANFNGLECPTCNGQGRIVIERGRRKSCPTCTGSGLRDKCVHCGRGASEHTVPCMSLAGAEL